MTYVPENVAGQEMTKTVEGIPPEIIITDGGKVYLYSGETLKKKGESGGRINYSTITGPGGIEIDLLEILSPKHQPMDGLAVYVSDDGNEVRWAKSDGVTNTGKEPNLSGKLADLLVRKVAQKDILERPGEHIQDAERESEMFGLGVSTVEYGKVMRIESGWEVQVAQIGSSRTRKDGVVLGGDVGITEAYYLGQDRDAFRGFFNKESAARNFVGRETYPGRYSKKIYSGDQPLVLTSATDGVKSIVRGVYSNSGLVMERWLREAAGQGVIGNAVENARKRGYLSSSDDISLVSIHLPKT